MPSLANRPWLLPRLTKSLLHKLCSIFDHAPFEVKTWDGQSRAFGQGAPQFTMTFRCWPVVWRILAAPDPGLGDAYIAGDVEIDRLPQMLDAYLTAPESSFHWPPRWAPRRTSVSRQYRQVQSHYDRGNAFFALWLDRTRSYSCAYFRSPMDTLDDAQMAKIQHVLKKAQLRPGDRLLDIGSGWGALIMEAARRYAVKALGITLSRRQYEYSQETIHTLGLENRARAELLDYRELAARGETFDRIVSVGMIEHVGKKNLPLFLRTVQRLLAPGGVAVLHCMTRIREYPVSPYIQKHIFPGSYVPSWREMIALFPKFDFHLIDVESLRRHYALTLERWAARFEQRLKEVRALGLDEPFIRMWRLYLNACAASFRHGALDLHQFVVSRGINNRLAMTREGLYQNLAPRPLPTAHPSSNLS